MYSPVRSIIIFVGTNILFLFRWIVFRPSLFYLTALLTQNKTKKSNNTPPLRVVCLCYYTIKIMNQFLFFIFLFKWFFRYCRIDTGNLVQPRVTFSHHFRIRVSLDSSLKLCINNNHCYGHAFYIGGTR